MKYYNSLFFYACTLILFTQKQDEIGILWRTSHQLINHHVEIVFEKNIIVARINYNSWQGITTSRISHFWFFRPPPQHYDFVEIE
jgi:hypothetical protein